MLLQWCLTRERMYIIVPKLVKQTISNLPAVCIGETVDVEAATRGTEVGPLRGTFRNNR